VGGVGSPGGGGSWGGLTGGGAGRMIELWSVLLEKASLSGVSC
jgi:hypothetical protein